ncbi:uncharacterized protein FOMMEDRAFT_154599 [Fomitiporia mediterranea MF3/22]|uniref:uncharacterized protein n=1 Tax=Fomitiporia mediterranea (strain MF3/22) TaxID=694068 RepID=UPI0004409A25|nr:uncharacterized protein FOMMEDRAFT_154599 [Fomitiporia mediterranea MF3/22]EJD03523.1 hypothetical protein FOMMEDRAFT_154599 [Fomitiporia mediterranea MF3/22]
MLFTRVIPYFALFLSFGTLAIAKPIAAIEKRGDISSVENVFTMLKSQTDSILPQFHSLALGGNTTDTSMGSVADELTAALNEAYGSLASIGSISSDPGNSTASIANLFAEIIQEIVEEFGLLNSANNVTDISVIIEEVDIALAEVVAGLELVLAGVITLLTALLGSLSTGGLDVGGLSGSLEQLGFTQTLGILKI